jgi:hypothetical protein
MNPARNAFDLMLIWTGKAADAIFSGEMKKSPRNSRA